MARIRFPRSCLAAGNLPSRWHARSPRDGPSPEPAARGELDISSSDAGTLVFAAPAARFVDRSDERPNSAHRSSLSC